MRDQQKRKGIIFPRRQEKRTREGELTQWKIKVVSLAEKEWPTGRGRHREQRRSEDIKGGYQILGRDILAFIYF